MIFAPPSIQRMRDTLVDAISRFHVRIILGLTLGAVLASLMWSFTHNIQPAVDARAYKTIAINMLNGVGFRETPELPILNDIAIVRAGPGYELFLFVLYRLFGVHDYAVLIAQALLHGASTALLYLCARRIFSGDQGKIIGLFSAAIYGLSPDLIEISAMLMTEMLYLFLAIVCTYVFIRIVDEKRVNHWSALFGFILGVAFLVRPPLALFLPIVLVYLFKKRNLVASSIVAVCFAVVLIPWTVHNYSIYHKIIPTTLIGGYNIWVNNSSYNNGGQNQVYEVDPAVEYVRTIGAETFSEAASSKFKEFIITEPGSYALLVARRTMRYVSLIRPMGFWFYQTGFAQALFVASSGVWIAVLFTLGAAGMWLARREPHPSIRYLIAFTLAAPAAVIPIVVQSRYRFQIYPFLAIWSGLTLYHFIQRSEHAKSAIRWVFFLLLVVSAVDLFLSFSLVLERIKRVFSYLV